MLADGSTFDGREEFLQALRKAMSVSAACRRANRSRKEMFARREQDDAFKADWDDALLEGIHFLEDAARCLAVGDEDPPGLDVDTESRMIRRTYDGALLRFLLKAAKPDVYGAHPRAGRRDVNEPIWMDPDPPRSDQGSDR